jgi:hypothetical protein
VRSLTQPPPIPPGIYSIEILHLEEEFGPASRLAYPLAMLDGPISPHQWQAGEGTRTTTARLNGYYAFPASTGMLRVPWQVTGLPDKFECPGDAVESLMMPPGIPHARPVASREISACARNGCAKIAARGDRTDTLYSHGRQRYDCDIAAQKFGWF